MKPKIAILGYKDFIDLTKAIIKNENKKADIDVYQCLLDECLEVLPLLKTEQTDIIITGRANKQLLETITDIPIITFKITAIDIISAIKKALNYSNRIAIAMANFEKLEYDYSILAELLNIEFEFLSYNTQEELENKVKAFSKLPGTVIGTTVAVNYAKKFNLNSILIYSLENTIKESINRAIELIEFSRKEEKRSKEFEAIINTVNDGILATNEDNKITLINYSANKLLTLQGKEIGQNIDTIFSRVKHQQILDNQILKDELVDFDKTTFNVNRVPIMIKGKKAGNVTILRDITEVQKLEQKYRHQIAAKGMTAKGHFNHIIYQSTVMEKVIEKAKRFSKTDSTILISGETGTGKELFAQSIHNYSRRKDSPFVAINCGALPESLLESELFGYVDGAFTGAHTKGKKGLFELAHNGTVFLDEINSVSPQFQTRLLRVLQEKEVVRIGGNSVIPVNIRVIAASNESLLELVRNNQFRRDLFYRLNVLNINIPSLNERIDDVIPLTKQFLLENNRPLFLAVESFFHEICNELMNYNFTGNIRELYNILERFVILSEQIEEIERSVVIKLIQECMDQSHEDPSLGEISISIQENYKDTMLLAEKSILNKMYEMYRGNKGKLAKRIGIGRTTLYRKLKEFDIE